MYKILERPSVRGTFVCLMIVTLLLMPMHQPAQGEPVVQVIVVAIGFGLIGVGVACLTQLLDICTGGGGKKKGGGGSERDDNPRRPGGEDKDEEKEEEVKRPRPNPVPQACQSATTNACGMGGIGFMVGGVCNATPPSDSACPTPTIGELGFYADPDRVRRGNTTTLYWDVADATVCSLTGGGLNLSTLGIVDDRVTPAINAATFFTLSCSNGISPDSPTASQQITVTLIPEFQEI